MVEHPALRALRLDRVGFRPMNLELIDLKFTTQKMALYDDNDNNNLYVVLSGFVNS